MERVIHKYFDKMEALEEKMASDVDSIVNNIDIKAIIANPREELYAVISVLLQKLEEEYHVEAFNMGRKLAEDIQ